MKISKLNELKYNKELSPDIWENFELKPKIRQKLLDISDDFCKDIDFLEDVPIIDIVITGSMANYSFREDSDIDVHIIIDYSKVNDDIDLVKKAIDGQRFIWNLRHKIKIKGHDVEIYIQDQNEQHLSTGVFSLKDDKWITKPEYNPPSVDEETIDKKYFYISYDINRLNRILKRSQLSIEEYENYYEYSKNLKTKILKFRKRGLYERGGEFSIENLVFKKLRIEGQIEKLIKVITGFYDKIYSQT